MTKIRIALAATIAIASLLAGGVAVHGTASAHPAQHLAGPVPCCSGAVVR